MKTAPNTHGPLGAGPLSAAAPLYRRQAGVRSTPPPGWAAAYRLKHGGPSGLVPRSKRPVVAKEVPCT